MKNEQSEEQEKIGHMSVYDKMSYLNNLILFHKQTEDYNKETIKGLYDRILYITKGYNK